MVNEVFRCLFGFRGVVVIDCWLLISGVLIKLMGKREIRYKIFKLDNKVRGEFLWIILF